MRPVTAEKPKVNGPKPTDVTWRVGGVSKEPIAENDEEKTVSRKSKNEQPGKGGEVRLVLPRT